eukprot:7549030-Pyramimonas_sp.AAC.1
MRTSRHRAPSRPTAVCGALLDKARIPARCLWQWPLRSSRGARARALARAPPATRLRPPVGRAETGASVRSGPRAGTRPEHSGTARRDLPTACVPLARSFLRRTRAPHPGTCNAH